MKITKELFVVPDNDSYFLYAPLKGSVLKVNSGVIGLLKRVQRGEMPYAEEQKTVATLRKYGILVDNEKELRNKIQGYRPTSVTLLPTFGCNLRCTYCYARGGEDVGERMNFDTAKSAIDLVVANASLQPRIKKRRATLGFHGGGEPLLPGNMELIRESVEYFRRKAEKRAVKTWITTATNGVLADTDLEWLVQNFNHLHISLDGPNDIQNSQRPKANGDGSFDDVMRTISYLEERKFRYGIRATITSESVSRMPEILEFFYSISSCRKFHLEPLFECGRCATSKSKAPSPKDFLRYALKTREIAEELGVEVYYSGGKLEETGATFCGASGRNFFVNPSGMITTCLEVCRDDDSRKEIFMIGEFDRARGLFVIDSEKLTRLRARTVDNIPYCGDCFAKYNCRGDCPAKVYAQTGNLLNPENNLRCEVNQAILLDQMRRKCKDLKGGRNETKVQT